MHKASRNIRRGSVIVGDWVFIATILILGAITGMVVRPALIDPDPSDRPTTTVTSSASPADQ
jgi:hypothetical protein